MACVMCCATQPLICCLASACTYRSPGSPSRFLIVARMVHAPVRCRYFDDGSGICVPCLYPCATCSSATTCTSCSLTGTTQFFLSGATCVSSCPEGTYGDVGSNMCRPCASTCWACTGPSDALCTLCLAPLRQLTGPAPATCDCVPGCVPSLALCWVHRST